MIQPIKSSRHFWIVAPVIGILLFIVLYFIATLLYPGGSQFNKNAEGFSWINNYWCNLLNENAENGQSNTARPIALSGMFVLCLSLSIFWYQFSCHMPLNKFTRLCIRFSGTTAMITTMFLFTGIHDAIINIAGLLGLATLLGTIAGLYRSKWFALMWLGIFNLVLMLVNNVFYYTQDLLIYLPVIQKITFVTFLSWFCFIAIVMYRKTRTEKAAFNK